MRSTSAVPWHRLPIDRESAAAGLQLVGVPSFRTYIALWLALASVTAIIMLAPDVPVAVYEPRLSLTIGSISGVAGLALLQLGLLRFKVLRQRIDLYAGMAFGALAISNFFVAWVPLPAGLGPVGLQRGAYFLLLVRAAGAVLFACGLLATLRNDNGARRSIACYWFRTASSLGLVALVVGAALGLGGVFPPLLDPTAAAHLRSHEPIMEALQGQSPALIGANMAIAVALAGCTIGYVLAGQQLRDAHIAALSGGLIFLTFGQLNRGLMPSLPVEYVTAGDVFCLVGYGLVVSNILWRTAQDFAENASHEERLRLSRELHDGLAQQLAVLSLRLGRLEEATEQSDPRARDVAIARCVVESASVEARTAIAALRSDRVTWMHMQHALTVLSQEFAMRHDVEAYVRTTSSELSIDSQLQVDVLRIIQEAFSNAVRHGRAKRIEAVVTALDQAVLLTIDDDGQGFEPASVRGGVGLYSMSERAERRNGTLLIESAPGQGVRIEARLPMSPRGRQLA